MLPRLLHASLFLFLAGICLAQPRARDLGVPFDGQPGPLNAITDVPGVEVGHTTLIRGEGALAVGQGPVRTGVTVIFPRGRANPAAVYAGRFILNGNGEMTGTPWIDDAGSFEGPIGLTNTHSVGVVRDAIIQWQVREGRAKPIWWSMPVVAETWDGWLNDINGFHVRPEHVFAALDGARGGPVAEGGVGGGTGMICHEFKGGIGTSSRRVGAHTVGVLVQANHGLRAQLRIAGVPVGREIAEGALFPPAETGSIIIIVATDAPLAPHQLRRVAKRAALGLARNGSVAGNGSGDLFLAFSTANEVPTEAGKLATLQTLAGDDLDPLFAGVVEATEEAIVNALVAGETMIGIDGHRVIGLPHERLREVLRKYQRLAP
jgi:D-aminopeptidase